MKRTLVIALAAVSLAACKKETNTTTPVADFNTMKQTVITDFTNNVAIPSYKDLSDKADNFFMWL